MANTPEQAVTLVVEKRKSAEYRAAFDVFLERVGALVDTVNFLLMQYNTLLQTNEKARGQGGETSRDHIENGQSELLDSMLKSRGLAKVHLIKLISDFVQRHRVEFDIKDKETVMIKVKYIEDDPYLVIELGEIIIINSTVTSDAG